MNFIQHRPNFVESDEPLLQIQGSLRTILNNEYIKSRTESAGFYRFSFGTRNKEKYPYTLMAEYNEGFEWYVVGYLDTPPEEGKLPKFVPKGEKYDEKRRLKESVIKVELSPEEKKAIEDRFNQSLKKPEPADRPIGTKFGKRR